MLVCCIHYFGRMADAPLLHASSKSRGNDATALHWRIRMSICREIRALTPEGSEKCLGNVCTGAPLMFKITKRGWTSSPKKSGTSVSPSSTSFYVIWGILIGDSFIS